MQTVMMSFVFLFAGLGVLVRLLACFFTVFDWPARQALLKLVLPL